MRTVKLLLKRTWKAMDTPVRRIAVWIGLALSILVLDYSVGPDLQFPILFLIPVSLASWHSGRRWGYVLALAMPAVRFGYVLSWHTGADPWEPAVNAITRMVVLLMFAVFLDQTALARRALANRVRVLEGMLPICCVCKRIRNGQDEWEQLEHYISDHSQAEFTHGICPECAREHYGYTAGKDGGPGTFDSSARLSPI